MPLLGISEGLLFQACADAGFEQRGIEWLWQIILRARLDATHHALQFIQRRDHDHRNIPRLCIRFQFPQHRVAVHFRHHHIEKHQIERRRADRIERGQTALRSLDLQTMPGQTARQNIEILAVVIHRKHTAVKSSLRPLEIVELQRRGVR